MQRSDVTVRAGKYLLEMCALRGLKHLQKKKNKDKRALARKTPKAREQARKRKANFLKKLKKNGGKKGG